jgi:tetratricopeptide (TPR) repeat protein
MRRFRPRSVSPALLGLAAAALLARPAAAQDLLAQARALADRGRWDSAYVLIQRAADAEPNRAEVHFWLGSIAGSRAGQVGGLGALGPARKSKRGLARAVELEPDNPRYLQGLIGFLSQAPGIVGGDRDSALVLAERLRRLDAVSGTFQMADVLRRGNEREKTRADSLVDDYGRAHAADRAVQLSVAGYYASTQRVERSLAIDEQLLARDPRDVVARFGVGRNLVVLQREPRRAIELLRVVAAAPPPAAGQPSIPPAAPWWRIGQAFLQLGMPDSARAYYLRALAFSPVFPQAQASLDSLARR